MKYTQELLAKEMTRKEFLRFMGLAVIALFGLSNFVMFLRQQNQIQGLPIAEKRRKGFGSSKFGV